MAISRSAVKSALAARSNKSSSGNKSWGSSRSRSWGSRGWGSSRSSSSPRGAGSYGGSSTPSTTNYGTRPAATSKLANIAKAVGNVQNAARPPSVMPGQPGVPTASYNSANQNTAHLQAIAQAVKSAQLAKVAQQAKAAQMAQNVAKAAKAQSLAQGINNVRTAQQLARGIQGVMQPGGNNGGNYNGGSSGGGGGGGSVTPTAVTPAVPQTTPAVTPTVAAPAPATTAPSATPPGTTAGTYTSSGRQGTFGRYNRDRTGRGPQTNLSITPEMLQRISAQRITNR